MKVETNETRVVSAYSQICEKAQILNISTICNHNWITVKRFAEVVMAVVPIPLACGWLTNSKYIDKTIRDEIKHTAQTISSHNNKSTKCGPTNSLTPGLGKELGFQDFLES